MFEPLGPIFMERLVGLHRGDILSHPPLAVCMTCRDFGQKIRARATVFYSRLFEKVDVIVTPTTAITAPRIHPGVGKHGESNLPQVMLAVWPRHPWQRRRMFPLLTQCPNADSISSAGRDHAFHLLGESDWASGNQCAGSLR